MNYIVCLKWGDKYSPDYVNNLASMVDRHTSIDHEFICFTEDRKGINKKIRTEPLPTLRTQGWWYKPMFLGRDLPFEKGTLLFLDLDVVIFNSIDKLFAYHPEKFCVIRDFNRSLRKSWDRMNSSVFKLPVGLHNDLWQDFKKDPSKYTQKNRGDQDMMFKHIRNHVFWPDDWIMSYKWEMRDRNQLQLINGKRNFKEPGEPKIHNDTSIAVFHGEPNPKECIDPWVKKHWG